MHGRGRTWARGSALLLIAALVGAACTRGGDAPAESSPEVDLTAGTSSAPVPTPPEPPLPFLFPDQYPVLPDRAPLGVDTGPLTDPPSPAEMLDPFRPVDPDAGIMNLDHLIFIVQENRSFDHYFGTFPGADGIPRKPDGTFAPCVPDPNGPCRRPYHDRNTGGRRRTARLGGGHDGHQRWAYGRVPASARDQGEHLHPSIPTRPPARERRRVRAARPTRWGSTPSRRSRTTGPTRVDTCSTIACSRRSIPRPCPRTCSWCRGGRRRARTSTTP